MDKRNIIVIGTSMGGFEVLKRLVQSLPKDLEAAIFIVWHMGPDIRGILPDVLSRLNTIPVAHAYDMEPIVMNRIYIAPPDHHLLIERGRVRVTHGPKENRFRPAVDPLFRSAAYTYGKRVIGVVLTGALDDGTAGLWRIKHNGGLAVVQDPDEAEASSMPANALREVDVDYCIPIAEMAALFERLSSEHVTVEELMKDEKTKIEINIAAEVNALEHGSLNIGVLSPFTCPECHGVLSKIMDGSLSRFRCHTGHAYSEDTLLAALAENVEDGLYNAIRSMDETIILLNHLGDHHAEGNQSKLAAFYFKKAQHVKDRSDIVRGLVHTHEQLSKENLIREAETS